MNWFKNLNATPRLMSSFGVLLVLTLGISYLAIDNLSKANDRIQALYQQDMKGVIAVQNIAASKLDVARLVRDAIIKIDDPAAVTADLNAIKAAYVIMRSNLQEAELCFYTAKGKEMLANIRDAQPKYEQAVSSVEVAIEAKDAVRAKADLLGIAGIAAQMATDIDEALKTKKSASEEKFQLNNQAYKTARTVLIGACIFSMVLGIILSIVIARGFSLPLGQAVAVLEKVAGGDLTVSLDVNTKDEVGRMAGALNRAVEMLNSTLQEVAESAASASSSSQQLAAASEAIASGAQEQAASLEQITAAVRQSSDNANQASQLASSSKDSALQGQEVVTNAITAMSEINAASAKISDIISTIDEIAFQTNLLAVNAAVEAARAGDEGRGFAVVASEVRSLAQRSAVAAKEIKVLIQDSLRKVEAGSGLVNRSGETLQGIVGSVKRVTDIVGEIAAASGEQSTGIEQVNTAVTQMDQVTQSNSAQTEELSATAQSLAEQASHLMELVGTFTLTQDGRNARDSQAYQPREANPVHSMVASLVQTVRPSIVRSTPHSSLAQQSSQAAQHPGKAARSTAQAKPVSRTRGGKGQNIPAPALLAVSSVSGGGDASFVEF